MRFLVLLLLMLCGCGSHYQIFKGTVQGPEGAANVMDLYGDRGCKCTDSTMYFYIVKCQK